MTNKDIKAIRRRFERWELSHLRTLAAELQDRLERAQEDAEAGWRSSEFWQQNAMELQQELLDQDLNIGLTKEGRMVVIEGKRA